MQEEFEKPDTVEPEEQQTQPEAKNSKKELWLFLIFVDIIALCVLGFFVYNSFFEGINTAVNEEFTPQAFLEEVMVEDIKDTPAPKEQPKPAAAKPAEPAKPSAPAKEEPAKTDAAPVQSTTAKPAEVKPVQAPSPAKTAEPAKQSIVVSGSGKTRKVTFKYFGDAKKAAVIAGFTMRKPVAMKKDGGVWSVDLVIYPGEYRYLYVIDGKTMPDPYAKEDEGRSVLIVK